MRKKKVGAIAIKSRALLVVPGTAFHGQAWHPQEAGHLSSNAAHSGDGLEATNFEVISPEAFS
jgi:hypothetical protein